MSKDEEKDVEQWEKAQETRRASVAEWRAAIGHASGPRVASKPQGSSISSASVAAATAPAQASRSYLPVQLNLEVARKHLPPTANLTAVGDVAQGRVRCY
eukprot:8165582-Lingulodinium_polyedra.AAC.1